MSLNPRVVASNSVKKVDLQGHTLRISALFRGWHLRFIVTYFNIHNLGLKRAALTQLLHVANVFSPGIFALL